jgi:DHA2 family multidrug resistance protein-like MFS transporter
VFLLALPVMALLLVLGPTVLPEYKDPEAGRLDLASAVMSLIAVLSVIFGLKQIAQDGFGPAPVAAIALGLGVGALFVRRQLTLADPMIDLRLFRIPSFSGSLAINFVSIFVAVGYFLFIAQYLQLVLGLSPLVAGLWSLPSAVGFIVGSQAAPRLVRIIRPAHIIGGGLAMAAIGLAILTQVGASGGLAPLVLASLVISLGLAPVLTLTTDLIVGSAPPEQAGAASGISETGAELGGALGIAILGSIGTAVYRTQIAEAVTGNVPVQAAAAARDTLGAAVVVAADLPGTAGSSLLEIARDAFVHGMQVTSGIAAVIAIGFAVVAVVALRNLGSGAGGHTGDPDIDIDSDDEASGEPYEAPAAA